MLSGRIGDPVRMGVGGWGSACVIAGCMLYCFSAVAVAAGEDDYLNQIQSEAFKIEENTADNTTAVPGDEVKADKDAFDEELKDRYRGSYLFYRKLPQRSQEEIFSDYAKGASIEDIRTKILDRYLHGK